AYVEKLGRLLVLDRKITRRHERYSRLANERWWNRKQVPEDEAFEELEKAARAAKHGLWADPHPVPSWEWRKRRK
ncbi:MAG: hypothetical protein ACREJN_04555, partial [Nitrospiraceae bacterium]